MKAFVWNKRENTAAGRRIAALLLCFALLAAAFSGCAKKQEEPTAAPTVSAAPEEIKGKLTAPYTSLDSLNPFFCRSLLNSGLIPLVFRSLYKVNNGFTAEQDLALNETLNGLALQVSLPDTVTFSDGVLLTAQDVAYSFALAKESPLFREALSNVERCEPDGKNDVTFYLKTPDCNVQNVLTFPIAKRGTADEETDLPVGAGYFAFRRSGGGAVLYANDQCRLPAPAVGAVALRDVTQASALMHMLDVGDIDCFYTDLSDGAAKRSYAGSAEVYLNNLVFLGVNHASYRLDTADVRRAVSLALSRSRICENVFMNHARAAFYPVNTSWTALSSALSAEGLGDADVAAADALLAAVGAGTGGDTLTYRLLAAEDSAFVKTAAQLIEEQLAAVNIRLEVSFLSRDAFRLALSAGEFDFYLAEIKLTKNMDLSPFFSYGGAAAYGMNTENLRCDTTYGLYRAGQSELKDFLEVFAAEMPFIPLLFRNGQFCYSRRVLSGPEPTEEDLFRNFENWSVTEP